MLNLEYRGKSAKVNIVLYEWLWDMLGGNVTAITGKYYTLVSIRLTLNPSHIFHEVVK